MTASVHGLPARHSKRRRAAPRAALLAFVILAVVAAGAGGVLRVARADTSPVATDSSPTTGTSVFRLGVRVTAEVGTARFTISTSRIPARALLSVDPAGSAPTRAVPVNLSAATTEVVLRGLSPGVATWTLGAEGAEPLHGKFKVPTKAPRTTKPAAGTPSSQATELSSDTEPDTSDQAPARAPQTGASTPSPAPPSRPPSTPKPSPAPSPTPRPTGPASPYDPDDH